MSPLRSHARVLVVDIGGGSVELTCGDRHRIENSLSLPIGAVRLTLGDGLHAAIDGLATPR